VFFFGPGLGETFAHPLGHPTRVGARRFGGQPLLEVQPQGLGVGVAEGRILSQGPHDHLLQAGRQGWVAGRRPRDRLAGDPIEDHQIRLVLKEPRPGAELEQQDAQGEHIGAGVDRVPQTLLRAQVAELALDDPRVGAIGGGGLRDPEVDDLQRAFVGDQQVLRRDVPVHQAEGPSVRSTQLVGVVQPGSGIGDQAHQQRHRQPIPRALAAPRDRRQAVAGHVLHGQVVQARLFTQVEDLSDVRMRQARRQPGFVQEHPDEGGITRQVAQDPLDGHQPREVGGAALSRQPDLGHPSGREALQERVAIQALARAQHDLGQKAGAPRAGGRGRLFDGESVAGPARRCTAPSDLQRRPGPTSWTGRRSLRSPGRSWGWPRGSAG
jgi:hypothetical protein